MEKALSRCRCCTHEVVDAVPLPRAVQGSEGGSEDLAEDAAALEERRRQRERCVPYGCICLCGSGPHRVAL